MSTYRQIAALGSSFAAGPGIEPVDDLAAMRSRRNYAHLLADHLGATLVDLTVSGATTATILDTPQVTMSGVRFAPQVHGLPPHADLVTVTAGGNDLQFVGSMLHQAWSRADPTGPIATMMATDFLHGIPEPTPAAIDAMARGLAQIVDEIRVRTSDARVVLVDYLTVFTEETPRDADWPFSPEQTASFRRIQDGIAAGHQVAATLAGVEVLAASQLSADHALGSSTPWVVGFQPTLATTAWSFHPNEDGMAAVARALADLLAS
ncbi:MAG: SGNH/GDSL hydrolase family protein [Terracoccus sp.]